MAEVEKLPLFNVTSKSSSCKLSCLMAFLSVEPFTTMFPEIGPNQTHLFQKIRKVFDPAGVNAPGRQVYTDQEWQEAPTELKQLVNKMRDMVGLSAVE